MAKRVLYITDDMQRDLTQHCHDIASALGAPLSDPIETVPELVRYLTAVTLMKWKRAGHEPIQIATAEDGVIGVIGGTEAATTLTADRIDLFRSYGGRRTMEQIQALSWHPAAPDPAILEDLVVDFFSRPVIQVEPVGVRTV